MVAITGQQTLFAAKRVIIKIGSSLLVSPDNDKLRRSWMAQLAADITKLRARNCDVILVSSGAVALGRQKTNLGYKALKLEETQALAAIGQVELAQAWAQAFAVHDITLGQVLLTLDDTENRRRWLNSSSTLRTLLQMGMVPLINENDSVASDEIRFGDNDRLAARTAQMIGADLLVLLSDIDGLYSADPSLSSHANHIPLVRQITNDIEQMAGKASTSIGTGGMQTKILAAKIAGTAGCATLIADGRKPAPISALLGGAKSTLLLPQVKPAIARKNWIAGSIQTKGSLIIDDGAVAALATDASLLAAGILEVKGQFERGQVVSICTQQRVEIARGLVSYSSSETARIQGLRSPQISTVLGYTARKAVVHRDNLVRTGNQQNEPN